jgi:hypothetical protein
MTSLGKMLGGMFKPQKFVDKEERKAYAAFRSECKKRGLTYKIKGDEYCKDIKFSDGRDMPHFTWSESLDRLKTNTLWGYNP